MSEQSGTSDPVDLLDSLKLDGDSDRDAVDSAIEEIRTLRRRITAYQAEIDRLRSDLEWYRKHTAP